MAEEESSFKIQKVQIHSLGLSIPDKTLKNVNLSRRQTVEVVDRWQQGDILKVVDELVTESDSAFRAVVELRVQITGEWAKASEESRRFAAFWLRTSFIIGVITREVWAEPIVLPPMHMRNSSHAGTITIHNIA